MTEEEKFIKDFKAGKYPCYGKKETDEEIRAIYKPIKEYLDFSEKVYGHCADCRTIITGVICPKCGNRDRMLWFEIDKEEKNKLEDNK